MWDLHYLKQKPEAWKIETEMYSIRYLHLRQLKLEQYFGFLTKQQEESYVVSNKKKVMVCTENKDIITVCYIGMIRCCQ